MNELPQLVMIRPDMSNLPKLVIPEGLTLCTHKPGDEPVWEEMIKKAFGWDMKFSKDMAESKAFAPENLFYAVKDGRYIATSAAVEHKVHTGHGWFHMVGAVPEARGCGAGRLVATATLLNLAERGYKSAGLTTDDERIPAIKLYLSLGLKPHFCHESHPDRWKKVMDIIGFSEQNG